MLIAVVTTLVTNDIANIVQCCLLLDVIGYFAERLYTKGHSPVYRFVFGEREPVERIKYRKAQCQVR